MFHVVANGTSAHRNSSCLFLIHCITVATAAEQMHLRRQLKFLALKNLCNVKIEEVAVQDRLDSAGKDGNQIVMALGVVSVDPVQQI